MRIGINLETIDISTNEESTTLYIQSTDGGYYCCDFECEFHQDSCQHLVEILHTIKSIDPEAGWSKLA